MKKLKITRYCDPGHSWFKVPRSLIVELGIESKISACSYQHGDFVYLEEDCDYYKFLKAYLKLETVSYEDTLDKIEVKTNHTNKSSKIRNYPSYTIGFKPLKQWSDGLKVKLYGKEYTTATFGDSKLIISPEGARYRLKKTQMKELELI